MRTPPFVVVLALLGAFAAGLVSEAADEPEVGTAEVFVGWGD